MRKSKVTLFLFASMLFSLVSSIPLMAAPQDIDAKVQALIKQMTLEEKAGQMTQLTVETIKKDGAGPDFVIDKDKLRTMVVTNHVGSILNCGGQANTLKTWHEMITAIQDVTTQETRLKIPVIYGVDSIHGANYIVEATLFPQGNAMAATGNPELVRQSAAITAVETRAAGIPWNFNPVLDLARNPLWSRFWENFGEDTHIDSVMAAAYVEGQQGNDISRPDKMAACMKHYLGYGYPRTGHDRTPAWIPDREMRELFLPPYKAAVDAGVATVMVNSCEINGSPIHASSYYLKTILRDELGFKGIVVTDWDDINNLYTREMVAPDQRTAVKMAVMAGIDMSMVPYDLSFTKHVIDLAKTGELPMSRIDEAVANILRVKFQLGLFEKPYPDKSLAAKVGTEESRAVSLQAACEAMTLLKNQDNALPLQKSARVLVTGPTADLLSVLNGGWTYTWQGDQEKLYPQNRLTVLKAIRQQIGDDKVTYVKGVEFDKEVDIAQAVTAADNCDAIIACVGEPTYCETPGNINDLTMTQPQLKLVSELAKTGKPVILVLIEGRPRVINTIEPLVKAVLMAYLPSLEGGPAIAKTLFGDNNPSGKLPFTYPRFVNDLTWYDYKKSENAAPTPINPQWAFGSGLSYTTFAYANLKASPASVALDKLATVTVTVDVTNSGARAGQEIVQLFVTDEVASITPPNKKLRAFKKISLQPGQTQTVSFELKKADLSFIDQNSKPATEPGKFTFRAGNLSTSFLLE